MEVRPPGKVEYSIIVFDAVTKKNAMSSYGGFGPAARAFLKALYASVRRTGHWVMAPDQSQVEICFLRRTTVTYASA